MPIVISSSDGLERRTDEFRANGMSLTVSLSVETRDEATAGITVILIPLIYHSSGLRDGLDRGKSG
uniref:Uncharacterized protein n=1 Tax=Romanomermis culicivorax TaxID=13658 RepID=A0A915HMU8_ROMCU